MNTSHLKVKSTIEYTYCDNFFINIYNNIRNKKQHAIQRFHRYILSLQIIANYLFDSKQSYMRLIL